ncbi:MAG: glycoside hydrolase family 3 C-terminal domain-containing protein [Sphingomonas sp.]|nr:glycoside hydrolase family 3 C-terminal domain-containing protein [Sphingomonas sp.]
MRLGMALLLGTTVLVGAPALAGPDTSDKAATGPTVAHPEQWPQAKSPDLVDPETEAFVTALIKKMSIEEKVGQIVQADISYIKPEDLRKYPLGSILAGGNSPPLGGDDRHAPQEAWVKTARDFRAVAMEDRPGNLKIPLIFGIDAVHGNANVNGATIFPHNVGLGAMHDPKLMRRIGEVTAAETAASGIEWAFGPTLTVPQNDRWGRTYEGYSEDPALVASYAGEMVIGLQGAPGTKDRIQKGYVAASSKHFMGDGGTTDGIDQGNTQVDEATFARIHGAGYPPAIDAGTMTVMASYNSWNGAKMHGNKSLLTGVLKGRMGFDGFVVGDWNAHGQIPGCKTTDCPATINAGLDMVMAPDGWRELFDNTVREVKKGKIPMARVDDAVRRILRVKVKLGLFDPARPLEGKPLLGTPEHRAVAREAVAESLVLLKNNGVLPVKASANVLVAGAAADSMQMQTGGWTLSWQGDGNPNDLFPGGTTIWKGIRDAVAAGGGKATLSADGSFAEKPDVAIVVFGEQPYAEMRGDIRTLEFQPGDKQALALLKKLKAAGIPTVSVFLSGRPLWVNPELNASDGFVAAWLPGSEGNGIADVIVGDGIGRPRRDFVGSLSYSWPKTAGQFVLNKGQANYDPQFALGYGLSYARPGAVGALSEESGVDASMANTSVFYSRGATPAPFSFATDSQVTRAVAEGQAQQEGAVKLSWPSGPATVRIGGTSGLDLTREANGDVSLRLTYKLDTPATGPVKLRMEGGANKGAIDATSLFTGQTGEWRSVNIFLKCYVQNGVDLTRVSAPFVIEASGPLVFTLAEARLVSDPNNSVCPGGK